MRKLFDFLKFEKIRTKIGNSLMGQLPKNQIFSIESITKNFRLFEANSTNWVQNWCSLNRNSY